MPGFPLQSGLETSVAFLLKFLLPFKNLVKVSNLDKVEFQNKFWLKPLEFFFLLEGLKPVLIKLIMLTIFLSTIASLALYKD